MDLAIITLVFIPDALVGMISASGLIIICLIMDSYRIYAEYQDTGKIEDLTKQNKTFYNS